MEAVLERGTLTPEELIPAIARRHVFPCWFGAALKLEGVDALLAGLDTYTRPAPALDAFGAKVDVYKRQGQRGTPVLLAMKSTS